jgi:predicted small secreted protein
MIEIIKNPVMIGLTIGVLVYIYLKLEQSQITEEKNKIKDTNLLIPLGIGTACWFIAHNYFENYNFTNDNNLNINDTKFTNDMPLNIPDKIDLSDTIMMGGGANLVNNIGNNFAPKASIAPSYHLLKRGVTIPTNINMPEVLLDNY